MYYLSNDRFIDGFKGWGEMVLRDGWKCKLSESLEELSSTCFPSSDLILAACDVEGNFLVVKVGYLCLCLCKLTATTLQAYQYTTLLSCMLLDA